MSDTYKDTKKSKEQFNELKGWTATWGKRNRTSRFLKRLFHRKLRNWQDDHERGKARIESEVNYRGW